MFNSLGKFIVRVWLCITSLQSILGLNELLDNTLKGVSQLNDMYIEIASKMGTVIREIGIDVSDDTAFLAVFTVFMLVSSIFVYVDAFPEGDYGFDQENEDGTEKSLFDWKTMHPIYWLVTSIGDHIWASWFWWRIYLRSHPLNDGNDSYRRYIVYAVSAPPSRLRAYYHKKLQVNLSLFRLYYILILQPYGQWLWRVISQVLFFIPTLILGTFQVITAGIPFLIIYAFLLSANVRNFVVYPILAFIAFLLTRTYLI